MQSIRLKRTQADGATVAPMTNATLPANRSASLARIGAAEYAALLSGEDEPEMTAQAPPGLWGAVGSLLADSARTMVDSSQVRGSSQAFARRAT
jgi:hypothetical protein